MRGFLLLSIAAGLGGCLYGPYQSPHRASVAVVKPAPHYYYAAPKKQHHGNYYWGQHQQRKRWYRH
ncbi:MAG: hypothetical protein AB7P52_03385 [Alphaproteobacteria bacterium]